MLHDIIYILKPDIETEELKYSLRSVEANFPHRFVWFICGQPKGFIPDRAIKHAQTGSSKWELIRSSMLTAVKEPELSDEFYLFNDDFFIMKPVTEPFTNMVDGTLSERIEQFRQEFAWLSPYARTLLKAKEELKILGKGEANFDVHLPMLFKKNLVTQSLMQCSSPQMRSIYGNLNDIPYIQHKDVKVFDMDYVPIDPDYLSTNDNTFKQGKVGEYIRTQFPKPSRFERGECHG